MKRRTETATEFLKQFLPTVLLCVTTNFLQNPNKAHASNPNDNWSRDFGWPGIVGTVNAILDDDGVLIVGGSFSLVDQVQCSSIAQWSEGQWLPLGRGIDGSISAMALYNGKVVAAGDFTTAGGKIVNNIAEWDGQEWHALGTGLDGAVSGLCLFNNFLVAGGGFSMADGQAANHLAVWNGTAWTPFFYGIDDGVRFLTVFQNRLVVCTGSSEDRVRAWNGVTWETLGNPPSGVINAIRVYKGNLFIGGGNSVTREGFVSYWDGTAWVSLPGPGEVFALAEFNGNLIAGGRTFGSFPIDFGELLTRVVRWNGSNWEELSAGNNDINGTVLSLATWNSRLVVGGSFRRAGDARSGSIAGFNGTQWEALSNVAHAAGIDGSVIALQVHDTHLFAGGTLTHAGDAEVSFVAKLSRFTWSPLADPFQLQNSRYDGGPTVTSLASLGDTLFVGGGFTAWGPEGVSWDVAAWTFGNWYPVGPAPNDPPCCRSIDALTVHNGALYAVGNRWAMDDYNPALYRWNGSSWSPVDSTFQGRYGAMASFNGSLVAGRYGWVGSHWTVDIASWDGTTWHPMGEGFNGGIYSLYVWKGQLVAGGSFTSAGGTEATCVALWNGESWEPLGSGVGSPLGTPFVGAMTEYNGTLVVGGHFSVAGGHGAGNLARWDGTAWSSLGFGPDGTVSALAVHNGSLYVAGSFETIGNINAANIAKWTDPATDIHLLSFGALRTSKVARVEWTIAEADPSSQVHVFRQRLNEERVEIGHISPGRQTSFQVIDVTPGDGPVDYWLREDTRDGSFNWYGPTRLADVRPAAYVALTAHPNPFLDRSHIAYVLPVAGHVVVKVLSASGALVRELADDREESGEHAITWDGRGDDGRAVASGVYWIRLNAGGRIMNQKVVKAR